MSRARVTGDALNDRPWEQPAQRLDLSFPGPAKGRLEGSVPRVDRQPLARPPAPTDCGPRDPRAAPPLLLHHPCLLSRVRALLTPDRDSSMLRSLLGAVAVLLAGAPAFAQAPAAATSPDATSAGSPVKDPLVEFELMTWPEVRDALAAGKTTALIYTGGTEQRGPQNANGGHNLMARATVKAIALKLGNAIAMPVLPYTPNNASAQLPGTIGLTPELLAAVLERITEQTIVTGFRNVILMGDHGGGQPDVYRDVATRLDAKYAPQGVRVFYCDEVYAKAQGDFEAWLESQGYPRSSHAGIPDTSEMLYLGGDTWVRKDLIRTAVGDPALEPGQRRDPDAPRVNNGITGDARRSTAELGKKAYEMKVEYAVRQIRALLEGTAKGGQ
jgi:creatinine amidohydrolase